MTITDFLASDNWVGLCMLAGIVSATCGFLLVRFA
jgi:hypothetical protein